MTDTQWPRFEVFLIESDGKPAEHVGSVHAPDAEMALLNARDVFVRRPYCQELWVAPSARVLFRSGEELKDHLPEAEPSQPNEHRYLVFIKPNHRDPLALARCLSAPSPEAALRLVLNDPADRESPLWAVVDEADVKRSDPAEIESFFRPAETKRYKMHADFPTGRQMKEVRHK